MKEHNIDKLFREKLQEHSVVPTPAAWDQVVTKMGTARRKRGGYYAAAAAVVVLLSLVWVGLRQGNSVDSLKGQQQHTVAVQEQPSPTRPSGASESAGATESAGAATTNYTTAADVPAAAVQDSPAATPQAAAPAQIARVETSKIAPRPNKALPTATSQKLEVVPAPAPQQDAAAVHMETALAQDLPTAPKRQEESLPLSPATEVLPSADIALARAEQVVIRYDAANSEDENQNDEDRDNAPERVFSIMKKVKHGEIGLANIRKAKDNLLSGRFNKP